MTNNRIFDLRPIKELFSIVKNDLRDLDDQGMIDEGVLIKTVMYANDKLGISLREIKQVCISVDEYKAKLPVNFEKLYFATALQATNTIVHNMRNPFDNSFDRDIIYEAEIDRGTFGNEKSYGVTIKRVENVTVHNHDTFIGLDVHKQSQQVCHPSCPNTRQKGKYTIEIQDGHILTPFRSGELYIMYLATMQDEEGNILFPFHPMITPYYEWLLKEKIMMDCIFNSDGAGYAEKLKLAQQERVKAWLDAYEITTSKGYGEYVDLQRNKELKWYVEYFRYLQ